MFGGNVTVIFFNPLQFHLFRLLYHFDIRDYGMGQTRISCQWPWSRVCTMLRANKGSPNGCVQVQAFARTLQRPISKANTRCIRCFFSACTSCAFISCVFTGFSAQSVAVNPQVTGCLWGDIFHWRLIPFINFRIQQVTQWQLENLLYTEKVHKTGGMMLYMVYD